jgi:hypothetical protein
MSYLAGSSCAPCPPGLWCDGSAGAVPCAGLPTRCLGASGCASGFGGPRCGDCGAGFVEAGYAEPTAAQRAAANSTELILSCRACPPNSRTLVGIAVACALALAGALAAARLTGCAERAEGCPPLRRLDHLVASHEALLIVAARQVQVVSLLYAASGVPLPPVFRTALNVGGSLGLNACVLNGWEFSNSWFLRALLPLGAVPLLAVDFARLGRDHDPLCVRCVTNAPQKSAHGFFHPLYSTKWLGFSANLFLPFALMACTCRGGAIFYDPSQPCPASAQCSWGLLFVVLYVPAFAWFYVAPLAPCCRSERQGGARNDRNHKVQATFSFLAFRLFRQLPQLVNAFVVLLPGAPRAAAALLVGTTAAELALFLGWLAAAAWAQRTSPLYHSNLAPFETRTEQALYAGALCVVLATHGAAVACTQRGEGRCGPSLGDFALVGAHLLVFAAWAAVVVAYLCADHGELEACGGSDFDPRASPTPPPLGDKAPPPPPPAQAPPPTPANATARPTLIVNIPHTPRGGPAEGSGRSHTPEDRAAARRAKELLYSPRAARVAPER